MRFWFKMSALYSYPFGLLPITITDRITGLLLLCMYKVFYNHNRIISHAQIFCKKVVNMSVLYYDEEEKAPKMNMVILISKQWRISSGVGENEVLSYYFPFLFKCKTEKNITRFSISNNIKKSVNKERWMWIITGGGG